MSEQNFLVKVTLAAGLAITGLMSPGCEEPSQSRASDAQTNAPKLSEAEQAESPVQQPEHLRNPPADPRAAIQQALDKGTLTNDNGELAFVRDTLKVAGVAEASQVLVFSLTSHQDDIISRRNPRAIYFSDDCYIGFVPGGIIEYSDVDPDDATGFFTLDYNEPSPHPFKADTSCLLCHEGGRTGGGRGLMVRSVFVRDNGFPITSGGSFTVSHDTPMENRWGGWYVTGEHGKTRHMGNVLAVEADGGRRPTLDREAGANVTDLSPYFDLSKYPQPGSDIVALMVLEHQVVMHNLLTGGAKSLNTQMTRGESIARELGETYDPATNHTVQRMLASHSERILKHMLFVEEVKLDDPIQGDPAFVAAFQANERLDDTGASLKQMDLQTRMFKYRCSYMIYSRAFELMPELLKQTVLERLHHGLTGDGSDELFEHLGDDERKTIDRILRQTHEGYRAIAEADE